jgi:1,4-dihydroxy-2-naphthoate octaprenyltransferase
MKNMSRIQKLIFIRFLVNGILAAIAGLYFIIHPLNSYTGWIFFIMGLLSIAVGFLYYWYKVVRKKTKGD